MILLDQPPQGFPFAIRRAPCHVTRGDLTPNDSCPADVALRPSRTGLRPVLGRSRILPAAHLTIGPRHPRTRRVQAQILRIFREGRCSKSFPCNTNDSVAVEFIPILLSDWKHPNSKKTKDRPTFMPIQICAFCTRMRQPRGTSALRSAFEKNPPGFVDIQTYGTRQSRRPSQASVEWVAFSGRTRAQTGAPSASLGASKPPFDFAQGKPPSKGLLGGGAELGGDSEIGDAGTACRAPTGKGGGAAELGGDTEIGSAKEEQRNPQSLQGRDKL